MLFNGDQTGRMLADLGADVIKVEAPGVGDYLRDFLGQITPHHSPAHLYVNRNKRSITLDLRSEAGREVFFRLLARADIFVDGFAGDATTRLGIGYDEQVKVKPDIIYAQCSGFGSHGPYAQIPTHGQMMGALGGTVPLAMSEEGLAEEQVGGMGDGTVVGAAHTVMTALAALEHRRRTGEGCRIDGAGSDAALATQWFHPTYAWNDHRLTDRRSLAGGGGRNAKYHFYETADGRYVLFCAIEHKFWDNFCRVIGRDDLVERKDVQAPVDFGSTGADELAHELQRIFHTRTLAEWMAVALEHDIPMGPANQVGDLRDDPHLAAREIIVDYDDPHAGPITFVGWPAPVGGQTFEVRRPAPLLGEHVEEVLIDAGYTPQEISRLREAGTV